ncbi:MAG TPA: hypothetical protein VGO03_15110 [Acidimicrobiia bacterium]
MSLSDLMARHTALQHAEPNDSDRPRLDREYREGRKAWEKRHESTISEDYFGDNMHVAAVMTAAGRVVLCYPAGAVANCNVYLAGVLSRVEYLDSQAQALLPTKAGKDHTDRAQHSKHRKRDEHNRRTKRASFIGRRRLLIGTQLFSIAQSALGTVDYMSVLDAKIEQAEADSGATKKLRKQKVALADSAARDGHGNLDVAEAALMREARGAGSSTYLTGMVLGLMVVVALAVAIGSVVTSTRLDDVSISYAVAAGAVGACISVLTRLVNSTLRVDPAASKSALWWSGVSRVVIGAVFGAVVFVFASAGLVSLPKGNTATDPTGLTYLWVAFGFLAGFSERWVQDLIGSVETPTKGRA